MVGNRVCLLALLFVCVFVSPMGFAKSVSLKTIQVDLPTNYGTLQTEIHFDERDLSVALKVKKIINEDLIKVINYFHYVPKNTVHFNVDPYMKLTNGNARVFTTNIINLYNFPPSNSEHLIVLEDWLKGLVFHEFIHVTHLDQTRGVVDVGRKIFGSIAKTLPSITPRWFTEGVAVWGESHLMNGGRLSNPLFRKELLIQFLRIDYCKTIDCLDEPGVYPGGQLAYWAGAHFMEYLESKKPGTVKCLVEENSDNIPFFLNNVFLQCTGADAQVRFDEFRQNLFDSQPTITPESEAWGDKISNAFGSDDLQKGIFLDENKLFKVERERESEALVSYDLQENINMMISKFQFPISDIAGMTTVPGADNEQTDNGKYLIVSFNDDLDYRKHNRVWKLVNTETLLIEYTLPLKNDPSYVIGLGNNRFLTASFVDDKWIIERQKIDLAKNELIDSDVVHHFSNEVNLNFFKKIGQKIYIKLNRGEVGSALYTSDLTLENFYKIYESKTFFDLPVLQEQYVVLRENGHIKMLQMSEDFKKITTSNLDPHLLDRVTSVEITKDRVLVLENRLKTKEMTSAESLGYLKKSISNSSTGSLSPVKFQDQAALATLANTDTQSFPKFYHLKPHYWFFATGTGENLFSIGATTTFSDPMDLNIVDATILSYPSESKVGGNINFLHKFSSISDLWAANAFFNRDYSKTEFNSKINETTEGSVGTQYTFLMKQWTLTPGVYVSTTKTSDFISNRTLTSAGVNANLSYSAYSFDDYFQTLLFQMKLQNDHPDFGEDFINTQARLKVEGRFHERLVGGVMSSYGKLYKSGFRQGVLYGGGTSDISSTRWHEFYGLPYSNAYGNEIFTFRLYIDWNFWNIYRGNGFFPLFIKEAHLLLGREMLAADRIILENKIYRDKTVHSFFVGPRLKTNIFYFVPANIDLIFSTIKIPNGGNVNQAEFNVTADLF